MFLHYTKLNILARLCHLRYRAQIKGHSLRRACLQPATDTQNTKPRPPTTNAKKEKKTLEIVMKRCSPADYPPPHGLGSPSIVGLSAACGLGSPCTMHTNPKTQHTTTLHPNPVHTHAHARTCMHATCKAQARAAQTHASRARHTCSSKPCMSCSCSVVILGISFSAHCPTSRSSSRKPRCLLRYSSLFTS